MYRPESHKQPDENNINSISEQNIEEEKSTASNENTHSADLIKIIENGTSAELITALESLDLSALKIESPARESIPAKPHILYLIHLVASRQNDSKEDFKKILTCLREKNVDFDAKTAKGWNALQIAVRYGNLAAVECLIDDFDLAALTPGVGSTLFHLVVRRDALSLENMLAMLDFLGTKSGIMIDVLDRFGASALDLAAEKRSLAVIQWLNKKRMTLIDNSQPSEQINLLKSIIKNTQLSYDDMNTALIQLTESHVLDIPSTQTKRERIALFHLAIEHGNLAAMEWLAERCKQSAFTPNLESYSALFIAATTKIKLSPEKREAMLNYFYTVLLNEKNDAGVRALSIIVEHGTLAAIQWFNNKRRMSIDGNEPPRRANLILSIVKNTKLSNEDMKTALAELTESNLIAMPRGENIKQAFDVAVAHGNLAAVEWLVERCEQSALNLKFYSDLFIAATTKIKLLPEKREAMLNYFYIALLNIPIKEKKDDAGMRALPVMVEYGTLAAIQWFNNKHRMLINGNEPPRKVNLLLLIIKNTKLSYEDMKTALAELTESNLIAMPRGDNLELSLRVAVRYGNLVALEWLVKRYEQSGLNFYFYSNLFILAAKEITLSPKKKEAMLNYFYTGLVNITINDKDGAGMQALERIVKLGNLTAIQWFLKRRIKSIDGNELPPKINLIRSVIENTHLSYEDMKTVLAELAESNLIAKQTNENHTLNVYHLAAYHGNLAALEWLFARHEQPILNYGLCNNLLRSMVQNADLSPVKMKAMLNYLYLELEIMIKAKDEKGESSLTIASSYIRTQATDKERETFLEIATKYKNQIAIEWARSNNLAPYPDVSAADDDIDRSANSRKRKERDNSVFVCHQIQHAITSGKPFFSYKSLLSEDKQHSYTLSDHLELLLIAITHSNKTWQEGLLKVNKELSQSECEQKNMLELCLFEIDKILTKSSDKNPAWYNFANFSTLVRLIHEQDKGLYTVLFQSGKKETIEQGLKQSLVQLKADDEKFRERLAIVTVSLFLTDELKNIPNTIFFSPPLSPSSPGNEKIEIPTAAPNVANFK